MDTMHQWFNVSQWTPVSRISLSLWLDVYLCEKTERDEVYERLSTTVSETPVKFTLTCRCDESSC